MSDPRDTPGAAPLAEPTDRTDPVSSPDAVSPPLADVEPLGETYPMEDDADVFGNVEWYEDGGRKTALGAWAGVAVLSYATMQVTGYFADWPFVALVSGAVGYFCVRGVAVVLGELKRRRS